MMLMLIIVLQIVNHLNVKVVRETPERPPQPRNLGNGNGPQQPPVPSLNAEVTVPLKYHNNIWKSLDLPLLVCELELDLL